MNHMPAGRYHPVEPERSGEAASTLRDVLAILQRRHRLVLAAFATSAALVIAVAILQPRLYTATATIMINPRQEQVLDRDQVLNESEPNAALVESELEVLRSPQLAERLVLALNLDDEPSWNEQLRSPSLVSQVRSLFSPATDSAPLPSGVDPDVVAAVADAISVRRRAQSYVIDVSITTRDPQESARLANALIESYLQFGYAARLDSGVRASGWLSARLEELRQDVQRKEAASQTYRAESGLLMSAGVSLTEQQIGEVQAAVLTARADLAEKEARFAQVQALIRSGGSADSIASALNSEVIRDLRQREADLARRQTELENTLLELHPAIQNGRAELENVRGQIAAEISRIQTNLRNEVEVSRTRLETLETSLADVRRDLVMNNGALVRLNELEREAAAARSVYESFLQRYHEVSDQGRLQSNDVRIVAEARPPTRPSSPNLKLALALALVIGAVAGIGLALLAETLDDGVHSDEEIERRLGVPALASIPLVSRAALRLLAPGDGHPAGYLIEKPISAYAESFRVLKTAIAYTNVDKRNKVIAVTSAIPGEGKTTCALSLARVVAASGQSVLLIDCDVRRQALNEVLGLEPRAGLLQVLSGEVAWTDVVGRDEPSGAHVLPLSASAFTPKDVFASEAMRRLVDDARARYDLVVLDCAPVLAVAETRVVTSYADGVVVIARWGKTRIKALAHALDMLEATHARVFGVALNGIDAKASRVGWYGSSFYYEDLAASYTRSSPTRSPVA